MKLLLFLGCLFAGHFACADVVVSIRYFKSKGVSHYHLFLYQDHGKLIRQLTSPEDAHDVGPIFSEDGREIFFTRLKGKEEQSWRIGLDGKGLRQLAETPAGLPSKGQPEGAYSRYDEEKLKPAWEPVEGGFRLPIPGSKNDLFLPKADVNNFDEPELPLEPRAFYALTLRETASGKATRLPIDQGDHAMYCGWVKAAGSPFLLQDGLQAAFYFQHGGSTDEHHVGAIDLLGKRLVPITKDNPAIIVPHGTRPGFFSICEERYEALPGTTLRVNCLYLDWWDKDFKRVRFSRALSLFGGASVRVEGQKQLNIPSGEK